MDTALADVFTLLRWLGPFGFMDVSSLNTDVGLLEVYAAKNCTLVFEEDSYLCAPKFRAPWLAHTSYPWLPETSYNLVKILHAPDEGDYGEPQMRFESEALLR